MKKKAKVSRRAATDITVTGVFVEQRPLSAKTLNRIEAGLKKFCGKAIPESQIKGIMDGMKLRRGKKS